MMGETREERRHRDGIAGDAAKAEARYLTERRMQIAALLVLAAAVVVGTVLYAGVREVFLPRWWRFW